MSTEPWIRFATETPLENFEIFLTAQGFIQTEILSNRAVIFESKSGHSVLLPLSKDFADFPLRVADLVSSLAEILTLDRDSLSKTISSVGYDIFKIRTGIGRESFSVDLDDALDFLHNGYALVDYSAVLATSKNKISYIQGRRTNEVASYLDTVRMGQTEPGSFVLTLLLPNCDKSNLIDDKASIVGLGQKVSDALVKGLQSSKAALDESLKIAGARRTFTANFANALAEIVGRSAEVQIGLDQRARNQMHKVSFKRHDEGHLREIAEVMTPKEQSQFSNIVGTVVNVAEPRGQRNGTFVVETLLDGAIKNVRIPFSRKDRKNVIKAFDEKADFSVQIEGTLTKHVSGRFSLENPADLLLIQRGGLA